MKRVFQNDGPRTMVGKKGIDHVRIKQLKRTLGVQTEILDMN